MCYCMSTNQLSRSLHLRDLVVMGIILVQPTAPMPLFGVVQTEARGHVVTAVLVAMVAMLFTAISYARMAAAYPVAGSAYTYVGRQLHPALGFLTGWSMLLDYVVNPVICTIWSAKAAGNILPSVPYAVWAVFFAGLFTFLNLRRIQTTAKTNAMLAGAMLIVVAAVFIAVGRTLGPGTDYGKPFYDASTFDWSKMGSGTALAVLTYIGFDGVSTLAEETENPRRNVGRAMVIICLIIGTLSALEVYAGQLAWPASEAFPDVDTAYVHVAGRVGGPILFQIVNLTLLIATIGSGSGGQLAGARLLYGMGRDVHSRQQRDVDWSAVSHRRVPDELPDWRGAAELRCVYRIYGSESGGTAVGVAESGDAVAGSGGVAGAGFCSVSGDLAESVEHRENRGILVVGAGPGVWVVEDARVPEDDAVRGVARRARVPVPVPACSVTRPQSCAPAGSRRECLPGCCPKSSYSGDGG
jgi:hypothetical protein